MEFGSQNFFNRLKAGVTAGDPDVYVDLNDMVDRSVRYLVSAQVNASDVEDVLQEIKITVWRQMSFFLQSSADNTPSQRNAWLIKVTKSRINDFPIRDRKVTLVVKRRRWIDKTTGKSVGNRYSLTADGTRHSKEFAAFLKGIFGQVPDSGTES